MVAVGRNIRRKSVKIATRQIDHPFLWWVNTVEAMDIAVKKSFGPLKRASKNRAKGYSRALGGKLTTRKPILRFKVSSDL